MSSSLVRQIPIGAVDRRIRISSERYRELTKKWAYEIYKQHRAGDALEDWLEAEREVSMWWTCN